ncbi:hypothetical protein BJ912DRAFT_1041217 [Pholiota molesta]|nr:hypothetical protein BJ912DRAFT_1041217 [Pholiota molesta]
MSVSDSDIIASPKFNEEKKNRLLRFARDQPLPFELREHLQVTAGSYGSLFTESRCPQPSHTTIKHRYRTNLNARIRSLRCAYWRTGRAATRKFVDGVEVAQKCSEANVLGKAVEIRLASACFLSLQSTKSTVLPAALEQRHGAYRPREHATGRPRPVARRGIHQRPAPAAAPRQRRYSNYVPAWQARGIAAPIVRRTDLQPTFHRVAEHFWLVQTLKIGSNMYD